MAKENGRFVLHDSQGFGHGDGENFKNVVDFLKDRKDMPNVRGQVHAVWYVHRSSIILKKGCAGFVSECACLKVIVCLRLE